MKTQDGEILNYRIYSDGGVKIEGENMRVDFNNLSAANKYIDSNNIQIINLNPKTAVYYNQATKETYELGALLIFSKHTIYINLFAVETTGTHQCLPMM